MRYEIKYVFPRYAYDGLIVRVLSLPLLFREIYGERQVNNVYFDTPDFGDYRAAANGVSSRAKTRARWYGDLAEIGEPNLEIKYKHGFVGGKTVEAFPPFALADIRKLAVGNRVPALVNTYRRRYFSTPDAGLRITIDRDLRYYSVEQAAMGEGFGYRSQTVVLEIKFERDGLLSSAGHIQGFGWRAGKNSKYVNGVSAVHLGERVV
ncbi:MAG: VTC domain-containing protein [Peptococcaceae bacterium]|jgi:hypothetical protein|nr:VTC domain-containing protein [Peptococcaceae bacterium]